MPRSNNPTWTRDELVLALDLYLRHPKAGKTHPEVQALSNLLQHVGPKHLAQDTAKFRNPNGVSMKLMNFRTVDPAAGGGLPKGGGAEEALFQEFANRRETLAAAVAAIRAKAGAEPTRCWAFAAEPSFFPVVDAITEKTFDWWTSKGRDIQAGDRAIVWKYQGKEQTRGVVALAEVLSDPAMVKGGRDAPASELNPAYPPAERVRIRYVLSPNLPLWVGGPADDVLNQLSVSKARGGSVFNVSPEQFQAVLEAAGGWVSEEAEAVKEAVRSSRPAGQGRVSDVARRIAVERYAMDLAMEHYRSRGWHVEDVGLWCSYDLVCSNGKTELHVEVKGTTGGGATVYLTANEVEHARNHPHTALFVVTDIELSGTTKPKASGGQVRILDPWTVAPADLTPKVFEYRLPAALG